ncbi:MAG: hypothetical protein IT223_00670 [Crocinitomicaceae bacterium]|nr:hypothetical protein [Crocinitomicaceae bacterium]
MKTVIFILSAFCIFSLNSGCNNSAADKARKESDVHADHHHDYACPMHPEVTGHKGDKCPKCGMDLEPIEKTTVAPNYEMRMHSTPAQLNAENDGVLFFTPFIKGSNEKVPLDAVHGEKIHIISVSNDLAFFDHVHPEYQADGSYKLEVKSSIESAKLPKGGSSTHFASGGDYILFADYRPTGTDGRVEKLPLHITGKEAAPKKWTKESLRTASGNMTIELKPEGGTFFSGEELHVEGKLAYNGKPLSASELDDYLEAKAHMVVIAVSDKEFVHVHPDVDNNFLDLHFQVSHPGFYRGWVQVKYKGELYTFDFVMDVKEGSSNIHSGHEHKEEGHGDHQH